MHAALGLVVLVATVLVFTRSGPPVRAVRAARPHGRRRRRVVPAARPGGRARARARSWSDCSRHCSTPPRSGRRSWTSAATSDRSRCCRSGLVIFTTAIDRRCWCGGWCPVPLAAALAIGAVVAPPDAVAATSIARRVGMPRRVVTILEGESLVNDATALVLLRTAVVAIGSSVTVWEVGGDSCSSAGGGLAVGVAVAFVVAKIRHRLTDPVQDTTISFLTPFVRLPRGRGDRRLRRAGRRRRRTPARPQGAGDPDRRVADLRADELAHRPVPAGEHGVPADRYAGERDHRRGASQQRPGVQPG